MNESNPPSARPDAAENPFFQEWTGPFGAPPFGRIVPEHFGPAFDRAFAAHDCEVAAIAADAAAPSFLNTVAALELSGRLLGRVTDVFRALASAHSNPALLEIERDIAPRRARHWDGILHNAPLFGRIDAL
jgi:peptidyl-dipeptidase Dcp